MQRTHVQILSIIVIGCLVFFTNLGKAKLWDRDEPRNSGCAVEMMERGNLVVPMFNDELRPQKPALLYWLMISAYQVFGVTEFAARFWSALLAIGTLLATYGIGRRLFGGSIGTLSAVVLSTSMMFVVAGRAATPDSVLIFCSTMAMLFYVLGTFSARKNEADAPTLRWDGYYFPQHRRFVYPMYAMMGLAVLAKGPVGFILPCAIIGMFMLIMRLPPVDMDSWNSRGWIARLGLAVLRPFHPVHFYKTLMAMQPITLAMIVLVISAPWFVAVGLQTDGDWPAQFLLKENFARATTSMENHSGGWLYYPAMIVLGFFPWSVFLGPMVFDIDKQVTRRHHWSPAYIFLLCWIGVQVVLFSFAQTKLPSYVTPCYPALAVLAATFLQQLVAGKSVTTAGFQRMSFATLAVAGLTISIAMVIVGNRYLGGDIRLASIGLIPIVAGLAGLILHMRGQVRLSLACVCVCSVILATAIFGFGTVSVDQHRKSHQLLAHVTSSSERVAVATFGCLESSWVFYADQPIYELTKNKQTQPWEDKRNQPWDKKQWPSPEQFIAANPNAFIITTDEDLASLKSRLPGYKVIDSAEYFLQGKNLHLLGPGTMTPNARVADSKDKADANMADANAADAETHSR